MSCTVFRAICRIAILGQWRTSVTAAHTRLSAADITPARDELGDLAWAEAAIAGALPAPAPAIAYRSARVFDAVPDPSSTSSRAPVASTSPGAWRWS